MQQPAEDFEEEDWQRVCCRVLLQSQGLRGASAAKTARTDAGLNTSFRFRSRSPRVLGFRI